MVTSLVSHKSCKGQVSGITPDKSVISGATHKTGCFWCQEKSDISRSSPVFDFTPCECCKDRMAKGFTVIETTQYPNESNSIEVYGVYPTGRFTVADPEAIRLIFKIPIGQTGGFLNFITYSQMFA